MFDLNLLKSKIQQMLEAEIGYSYYGNEYCAYKNGYESALETLLEFIKETEGNYCE